MPRSIEVVRFELAEAERAFEEALEEERYYQALGKVSRMNAVGYKLGGMGDRRDALREELAALLKEKSTESDESAANAANADSAESTEGDE